MDNWNALKAEYENSRLLQFGLLFIPLIIIFYLLLAVFDQITSLDVQLQQIAKQQGKLQQVKQVADWQSVLKAEQSREQELNAYLWPSQSIDLGSADVQAALNKLFKGKIEALQIRISTPRWQEDSQAWLLTAELHGRLPQSQVQPLMLALTEQRPRLHVEQFSYFPGRNNLTTIQLAALLKVPAESTPLQGGSKT